MARAAEARCCWPPDSSPALAKILSESPTALRTWPTASTSPAGGQMSVRRLYSAMCRSSRPINTLWKTDKLVEFSLDYPNEREQDAQRGAGNWALIHEQAA